MFISMRSTSVPLFHCNGWCHTWMMPAVGGTLVCCREIRAKAIFDAIADEKVTHFGGAPIVLNTLVNAPAEDRRAFDHVVEVFTAGAPPAPATLARIEPMGFNVTHVYGLTETYGPATECTWRTKWDHLEGADRAACKARQGVGMPFMEHVTVMDPATMTEVPRTGAVQGEIMFRGNGVMKGYYRNPEATEESFAGGYFHSGDLALPVACDQLIEAGNGRRASQRVAHIGRSVHQNTGLAFADALCDGAGGDGGRHGDMAPGQRLAQA